MQQLKKKKMRGKAPEQKDGELNFFWMQFNLNKQ